MQSAEQKPKNRSAVAIQKSNVRAGLAPRREPYWAAQLQAGRYLGFRKIDGRRGSWIARARDEDTQKQRYQALGDCTPEFDFDAASAAARNWFASLDAGVTHQGPFTVADACREYVEDRRREKGPKTAADAEWRFKFSIYDTDALLPGADENIRKATRAFGRTDLSKLRPPAIKQWRESLGMTKAGANRMMTSLRAALNLAVAHNRVAPAAAQAWRAVKQHQKADGRRKVYLDIPQRRALLEAANRDVRDLFEAALLTGARPGEIAHLTRGAFDARTKTVTFSGKTGPRDVPVEGVALALFERLAKSKLPGAPLLTDQGQPWTKMEWSRQIRAAAAAAVVTDDRGDPLTGNDAKLPAGIVLYTARHCYITQAITDGLTTLDVARLTGTSLKQIEEHYGHLVQGAVRERLARVRML